MTFCVPIWYSLILHTNTEPFQRPGGTVGRFDAPLKREIINPIDYPLTVPAGSELEIFPQDRAKKAKRPKSIAASEREEGTETFVFWIGRSFHRGGGEEEAATL